MTAPLKVHIGQLVLEGWPDGAGSAGEFAAAFAGALEEALGGFSGPAPHTTDGGLTRSARSAAWTAAQAISPALPAEGS
jgi:hypothetical protein